MMEREFPGVEHLARKIYGAFSAVEFVAEDGMTEIMEMNADLVGAATVQSAFDQTDVAARPQDSILGLRGATLPARDAHPLPVDRMPRNCFVDHARCLSRGAGDEC